MIIVILFVTCVLLVMALTLLWNWWIFPRLHSGQPAQPAALPFVSVLIPARNEAENIGETLRALLGQDYPNFEIILLDDHSSDETSAIATSIAGEDARFRLVQGIPLPEDWMGKSWACHNLSHYAQGEILLFTDADVQWRPGALRAVIDRMTASRADLFTVWPTQITGTWSERLTVPLIAMVIWAYLPVWFAHHLSFAIFGAANGQCMAWRRHAYQTIGGHTCVRNHVLDDVTMARLAKHHGLRLRMADGAGMVLCRMYHNWPSVRDGFAKNILAGYGNSVVALVVATLFHWLIFLAPWRWIIETEFIVWGLITLSLGYLIRATSAAITGQRLFDAVFLPFSVLLMTRIALQAIVWHYTGGPRWKGRIIRRRQPGFTAHG